MFFRSTTLCSPCFSLHPVLDSAVMEGMVGELHGPPETFCPVLPLRVCLYCSWSMAVFHEHPIESKGTLSFKQCMYGVILNTGPCPRETTIEIWPNPARDRNRQAVQVSHGRTSVLHGMCSWMAGAFYQDVPGPVTRRAAPGTFSSMSQMSLCMQDIPGLIVVFYLMMYRTRTTERHTSTMPLVQQHFSVRIDLTSDIQVLAHHTCNAH